jgi:pimeloyl-ACP methyl ester carboxylesterase
MHREASDVLPPLLDTIGFREGLLLGHSDGASIAAIYAGSHQDHRVKGVVMIAPHFIVEDISVKSIAEIRTAYETSGLKSKLSRWHKDVDNAFYGWNGAWLDPKFRDWDIRHLASGRDCEKRVLLSGRCDRCPQRGPFAAAGSARGYA